MVDRYVTVPDRDSFLMTRRLAREEGLLVGGSCGLAMVAAVEVAKEYGRDTTIVVLLPDGGRGYLSKVYNDDWMRDHGFPPCRGAASVVDVLGGKAHHDTPPLVTVASHERVKEAIDRLHAYSVSQLPVVHGEDPADLSSVVGSVQEGTLLERLFRKPEVLDAQVVDVMDPPFPTIEQHEQAEAAFELLSKGRSTAVLVTDHGRRRRRHDPLRPPRPPGHPHRPVLVVSAPPSSGSTMSPAAARPRAVSGAATRPSPSGSTRPWPASASDRPRYQRPAGRARRWPAAARAGAPGAGGRLRPLLLSPFVLAELDYLLLGRVGRRPSARCWTRSRPAPMTSCRSVPGRLPRPPTSSDATPS